MKTYPKLFILLLFVCIACNEDENTPKLSDRELLLTYDWIFYKVEFGLPMEPGPEPEMSYTAWSFTESDFYGSDFTGTFYNLGDWSLEDDVLTVNGDPLQVIDISRKELVYELDGDIITRLAVKKIDR